MNWLSTIVIVIVSLYTVAAIGEEAAYFDQFEADDVDFIDYSEELEDFLGEQNHRMLRVPKTCRDGRSCRSKSDCKK